MRKYQKSLMAVVAVAVCLCVVLVSTKRPPEPSYQGKRLTEWLAHKRWNDTGQIFLEDESVRAVQAMGTNALPFLMSMLRKLDSQLKLRVIMQFQRLGFQNIPTNFEKRCAAMYGFRALGLTARPAFPQIVDLVLGYDDSGEAINSLTQADADTIQMLAKKGLTHADPKVRYRAARALGCLSQAPAVGVPALEQALKDPAPEVVARAAGALGSYGKAAQHLTPLLQKLSRDANPAISAAALESLQEIARGTASQG